MMDKLFFLNSKTILIFLKKYSKKSKNRKYFYKKKTKKRTQTEMQSNNISYKYFVMVNFFCSFF